MKITLKKIFICLLLLFLFSEISFNDDYNFLSINNYDIVLPLGPHFILKILKLNIMQLKKFFKAKIIFVGNWKIKNITKGICNICEFFDENKLYPGLSINNIKKFNDARKWVISNINCIFKNLLRCHFCLLQKKIII